MNSTLLYFSNIIVRLLPSSRCFAFKRFLYKRAGAELGKNVRLMGVRFQKAGNLKIGDNTFVGENSFFTGGGGGIINIGSNCDISSNVVITTGTHEIDMKGIHSAGKGISKPVFIGKGVWVGIGTIILPGVTIGDKAIIGAGSVVTKDIPPHCVVVGNPCKPIKVWNFTNSSWEKVANK